jgi:hypothetical protein
MERAKVLFGSYRRGDANDPDAYVAAVAAVLSLYDADLIREVTDPRTGIMTSEKYMSFMPNAGELKVYCEGIAARRDRLKRLGELPAPIPAAARLSPPERKPGDLATIFVNQNHHRYARLVEWSKDADPRLWRLGQLNGAAGIWVALSVLDERGMAGNIGEASRLVTHWLELSPDALTDMRDVDAEREMLSSQQAAE